MNNSSLYIVESPFQILCALEARKFFQLFDERSILVIKFSNNSKSNAQMTNLAKRFEFEKVIVLPFRFAISLNDSILLILLAIWKANKTSFKYLFCGEVKNTIARIAATNLTYEKCYFLDDGISTQEIQRRLMLGINIGSKNYSNGVISKLNVLLGKLFMFSIGNEVIINWFTCFEIDKLPEQRVVKHNFGVIKDYLRESRRQGDIFFIGGPISEDGKIEQFNEIESIRKAINFLQIRGNVTYCVHRRESNEKIAKIKELTNIAFRHSEFPLEIDLLMTGENQFAIASFFSTALHTLPLIYDIVRAEMFILDENKLINNFKDTYKDIIVENSSNSAICIIKDY